MLRQGSRSSLLQRIASQLSDPELLVHHIEAQERRSRPDLAAAYTPPRTSIEELVAGMIADVLTVDRVGVHDHFFDLGGDSLLATQVLSRIHAAIGAEISLSELFAAPTVAGLSSRITAAQGQTKTAQTPLHRHPPNVEAQLSFAQQRLWFLEHLEPGSSAFNLPLAVRLQGRLDISALRRALAAVVHRHEVLRSTFPSRGGAPAVEVSPPGDLHLPLVDLSALPAAESEMQSRGLALEESRRTFDLARGPLMRLSLLRLGQEQHVLIVLLHHIVGDGWSLGVLVRELATLYKAGVLGTRADLPALPIQYKDFAYWQRQWLAEASDRLLAYWRGRLSGAPTLLDLCAGKPRPQVPSARGATRRVTVDAASAGALRALARREGVTLFMALLAVFATVLHRRSGQKDLLIGTDVANRNRVEIEGLIGFFVNQLVLRADLSGDPTCRELLARIRQVTLEAYSHQDLPFDRLIEGLQVERSLHSSPLFQVKLILQNAPVGKIDLPGLSLSPVEVDIAAANLDLTLALWDMPEELQGWISYRTELFSEAAIARIWSDFELLLREAVNRPDVRISELVEAVAQAERKQIQTGGDGRRQPDFRQLRAVKPKALTVHTSAVVERGFLAPGQELPLVLRPALAGVDVADWAASHREALEADLLRYGGILFRNFGIDTPEQLERLAAVFCSDLFGETPVFFPSDHQLLWHNEGSCNHRWPRKIFFCCIREPQAGGETPLVDSRKVYERLEPGLVRRFEERQVQYTRLYGSDLGLDWRTALGIQDPAEVSRLCTEQRLRFEWLAGDRLKTCAVRPASARDPKSGAVSWFNQAQHWHISCLDPTTRQAELPRQCLFGDGGTIDDAGMHQILAAYRSLEVSFSWQRGDVLMLDNLLTAHGRNPFAGERKILVTMGEMTSYDDLQT